MDTSIDKYICTEMSASWGLPKEWCRGISLVVQWSRVHLPTQGAQVWCLVGELSRLVITFLPRSKCLLISWLQSPSAVILEPPKIKSDTVSSSISHEVMGPDAMILVFWMLSFKPTFSLSSFTFIRGFLVPLHFLPEEWCHLHMWCWRRLLRVPWTLQGDPTSPS